MGEAQPIQLIWDRIDEQRQHIRSLELGQADTKGKIDLLDSRLTTMSESMSQHRSESRQGMEKLESGLHTITTKIEAISLEAAQNRGAGISRRELFGWLGGAIAAIGGIITMIKFFV